VSYSLYRVVSKRIRGEGEGDRLPGTLVLTPPGRSPLFFVDLLLLLLFFDDLLLLFLDDFLLLFFDELTRFLQYWDPFFLYKRTTSVHGVMNPYFSYHTKRRNEKTRTKDN
jgi:hypothetical protein